MLFTKSLPRGVLMQRILAEILTKIWSTIDTYQEFSLITLEQNRESKPPSVKS